MDGRGEAAADEMELIVMYDPWMLSITAESRYGDFRREAARARLTRDLPAGGHDAGRLRRAAGDRLIRAGQRLAGAGAGRDLAPTG